mmetsp:Transcript_39298/g.84624  ORF Transcript_39298/g.84624 Transcript_39298/m.84624 type:complete len:209 (-) Transcript_39298:215-841(-)
MRNGIHVDFQQVHLIDGQLPEHQVCYCGRCDGSRADQHIIQPVISQPRMCCQSQGLVPLDQQAMEILFLHQAVGRIKDLCSTPTAAIGSTQIYHPSRKLHVFPPDPLQDGFHGHVRHANTSVVHPSGAKGKVSIGQSSQGQCLRIAERCRRELFGEKQRELKKFFRWWRRWWLRHVQQLLDHLLQGLRHQQCSANIGVSIWGSDIQPR